LGQSDSRAETLTFPNNAASLLPASAWLFPACSQGRAPSRSGGGGGAQKIALRASPAAREGILRGVPDSGSGVISVWWLIDLTEFMQLE
jgi:hypothetical protein